MSIWLRALLVCDDVRFEVGGGVSLIGVHGDRMFVDAAEPPIVLARLALFTCVAGLRGVSELGWRYTLIAENVEPGAPTVQGHDRHDPTADEHRIVSLLSPIDFPQLGQYRLLLELETRRERKSFDYYFALERAPVPPPAPRPAPAITAGA